MSASFYSDLPPRSRFVEIADTDVYAPVPDDWYILPADVRGSTEAIQAGRYKEVNTVGASAITALLNVAQNASPPVEIPFLFGGDGAVALIPPELLAHASGALAGTSEIARTAFGLDLRVGAVPVTDVRLAGRDIRVARFRISPNYHQAMFAGGGVAFAENLIKDPSTRSRYAVHADAGDVGADFTGLECRWQDIPSRLGETVALIVLATTANRDGEARVYRDVIGFIEELFGESGAPIGPHLLKISLDPKTLGGEASFRSGGAGIRRAVYTARTWSLLLAARLLNAFGLPIGRLNWGDYLDTVTQATDYRKFDDTLRMVISAQPDSRRRLVEYLDYRSQHGDLEYGMHVSDRALLTCVVFERMGPQVHFVDGADGGYALAAKQLKAKLAQRDGAA